MDLSLVMDLQFNSTFFYYYTLLLEQQNMMHTLLMCYNTKILDKAQVED